MSLKSLILSSLSQIISSTVFVSSNSSISSIDIFFRDFFFNSLYHKYFAIWHSHTDTLQFPLNFFISFTAIAKVSCVSSSDISALPVRQNK